MTRSTQKRPDDFEQRCTTSHELRNGPGSHWLPEVVHQLFLARGAPPLDYVPEQSGRFRVLRVIVAGPSGRGETNLEWFDPTCHHNDEI